MALVGRFLAYTHSETSAIIPTPFLWVGFIERRTFMTTTECWEPLCLFLVINAIDTYLRLDEEGDVGYWNMSGIINSNYPFFCCFAVYQGITGETSSFWKSLDTVPTTSPLVNSTAIEYKYGFSRVW